MVNKSVEVFETYPKKISLKKTFSISGTLQQLPGLADIPLWYTYSEHLMHEISDLMQGFTFSQVINYLVYISIQYFLPYFDSLCQILSQYDEKILP